MRSDHNTIKQAFIAGYKAGQKKTAGEGIHWVEPIVDGAHVSLRISAPGEIDNLQDAADFAEAILSYVKIAYFRAEDFQKWRWNDEGDAWLDGIVEDDEFQETIEKADREYGPRLEKQFRRWMNFIDGEIF